MAVKGLSLFGFLPEALAHQYLTAECVHPAELAALSAAYQAARAKLGDGIVGAGAPTITDPPPEIAAHIAACADSPLFAQFQAEFGGSCVIKMVEVDRLLAAQIHVDCEHMDGMAAPADLGALAEACLPLAGRPIQVSWQPDQAGKGLVIRHEDFNLMTGPAGGAQTPEGVLVVGPVINAGGPWLHVIQVDGRSYLRNGYHRAIWARQHGYKEVPALIITQGHAGHIPLGFGQELLTSGNPPTCGHFVADRATEVNLRRKVKVISVSWSEWILTAE